MTTTCKPFDVVRCIVMACEELAMNRLKLLPSKIVPLACQYGRYLGVTKSAVRTVLNQTLITTLKSK